MPKPRLLFSTTRFLVELDPHPFSPGTVNVGVTGSGRESLGILDLPLDEFVDLMILTKKTALHMVEKLGVKRFGHFNFWNYWNFMSKNHFQMCFDECSTS